MKDKITCKQEGGNDGYCYAVRLNGVLIENGLTKREATAVKNRLKKSALQRAAKPPMTFERFLTYRKISENLTEIAAGELYDDAGNIIPGRGFVYDEGCYIETLPSGELMLILHKDDWRVTPDRLAELELRLYEWASWEVYGDGEIDIEDKRVVNIAVMFANKLREQLGHEKFEEMRAKNAVNGEPNTCHSHDYCDANMVMADAIAEVDKLMPTDAEPDDLDRLIELSNKAHALAAPLLGSR